MILLRLCGEHMLSAGSKFRLGRLCKNKHEHEKTSKSLRYKSSGHCITCNKSRSEYHKKYMHIYRQRTEGRPVPTRDRPEKCECCGKPYHRTLALDHCHETSKFRGWLCFVCNTGIGKLGDNIFGVKKALAYLERAEL